MPLQALFLDVGDTLLTERSSRFAIYAEAAAARGLEAGPARLRELMVEAHRALPRHLDGAFRYTDPWFEAFIQRIFQAGLGLASERLPELCSELFERFEDPATFRLYDGARTFLSDMRARGLRLGVISNWSARLPRLLDRLELSDAFDVVLSSALEACEKPEPEIFTRALARLDVAASSALHVGDRPDNDVKGAAAVGLPAVLLDHGDRHAESGLERVRNFAELARYVEAQLP